MDKTIYIIPGGLFLFFLTMLLLFFYGPKRIPQEAESLVSTFIKSEANLDYNTLNKLYAFRAVVYIQRVYTNGLPSENIEVYASQIIKIGKETKDIAIGLGDYNDYSNIEYEWLNHKNIKVKSDRYSKSQPTKTPHILILAQDENKKWVILEEYITEYITP